MSAKQFICKLTARLGCFPLGLKIQTLFFGSNFIRVVNYHTTPALYAAAFEEQVRFFLRSYVPVSPADLDACLAGKWSSTRPGILLTFDDGYRSNHDTAIPILEKYGLRGWFFVPFGCIANNRAAADADFRRAGDTEPEPRLSWPECREMVARGHIIGCHTRSHVRLADTLSPDALRDEILATRDDMRGALAHAVDDFCWVGGEEWSYGRGAFEEIQRAGYRRAFMTNLFPVLSGSSPLWIQRTNIEASWPKEEVLFYLSGIMDLVYWPKRRRLRRKLSSAGPRN